MIGCTDEFLENFTPAKLQDNAAAHTHLDLLCGAGYDLAAFSNRPSKISLCLVSWKTFPLLAWSTKSVGKDFREYLHDSKTTKTCAS